MSILVSIVTLNELCKGLASSPNCKGVKNVLQLSDAKANLEPVQGKLRVRDAG
jgi:hypothetical protein